MTKKEKTLKVLVLIMAITSLFSFITVNSCASKKCAGVSYSDLYFYA